MLGRRKAKLIIENPENDVIDQKGGEEMEDQEVGNEEIIEIDSLDHEPLESDENSVSDEISETASTVEESNEELASLQKELSETKDKYLRLAAEFDNYRKRTVREKMEMIQTAGIAILRDILPFVDDFERGIEAAAQAENMDAMKTGIELIYSKLSDFLIAHHVKEIKAMNEPFNADFHEAVVKIPAPAKDMKGKVVDVIQKGYTLNDKIIRYPKVVVGE